MKVAYVYIMTNKRNGTLYTGITSDLIKRVWQHKNNVIPGFTAKYKIHKLVYYELHEDIREAIRKEKNIKAWRRKWKLQLIEKLNPNWDDLYDIITS
jgi:putative endonuclease